MRLVRWMLIALGAVFLVVAATALIARFSDGPIAVFPGGPLRGGELVTGPEPDWGFARDIAEIELQLVDPPRSRITWVLVHEGRLYVPCGYMTRRWLRWWKRWPHEAQRDGRALVRIDGKRYRRHALRVTDPGRFEALALESRRKYGAGVPSGPPEGSDVWFFELAPQRGAGSRPGG